MATTDHYESEGEESYFISMTDIMVGMLFVFIILLMYFAYRIQNTKEVMVPISELQSVRTQLYSANGQIKVLTEELARLRRNPLEKYVKDADAARDNIHRPDLPHCVRSVWRFQHRPTTARSDVSFEVLVNCQAYRGSR
jgi:hypothetical protein